MGMAAAEAWEVLGKAANLAQMSGLHAAMLVAFVTTILRVYHSNKRECARLERCHRRLLALLQWPTAGGCGDLALLQWPETGTGCGGLSLLLSSEMGDPFGKALVDAAGLVDIYKGSSLWRRLWSSGSMATQLRDMLDVVDSYCGLLLFVNAHLLLQDQAFQRHQHHPIPASSDATVHEANDTSQSPSCPAVTRDRGTSQGANGTDQEGMDNDPATGCERNVPAHLLPIVISHA